MTHLFSPSPLVAVAFDTALSTAFNTAISAANRSTDFMLWNTFLALIPLVLSFWLFRADKESSEENYSQLAHRSSWWIGCTIFVAFLPNAPYVLTDVIHLVEFIREGAALPTIVLVLIPQYLLFMLIGIEAYTLSLINVGDYLARQGYKRWIVPSELTLHMLCAIGIYLGRFPRFNSWDILTHPGRLALYVSQDLLRLEPIAIVLTTFVVIAALYWPLKQITLAMVWYVRSRKGQQLN